MSDGDHSETVPVDAGDQSETAHVDAGEGRLTRREKIIIKSNIIQMDKWQRERDRLMEMEWPDDEKTQKEHYARLKQLTQGISRGYKELVSGPAAPYLRDDHKVEWTELRKDIDQLHLEEPLRAGGGHN